MIDKFKIHEILENKLPFVDNNRLIAIGNEIYETTPHLNQTVFAIAKDYDSTYTVVECKITSTRLNKDGTSSFSVEGYYMKKNYDGKTYNQYYQANFKNSSIGKNVFLGHESKKDAEIACYMKNRIKNLKGSMYIC